MTAVDSPRRSKRLASSGSQSTPPQTSENKENSFEATPLKKRLANSLFSSLLATTPAPKSRPTPRVSLLAVDKPAATLEDVQVVRRRPKLKHTANRLGSVLVFLLLLLSLYIGFSTVSSIAFGASLMPVKVYFSDLYGSVWKSSISDETVDVPPSHPSSTKILIETSAPVEIDEASENKISDPIFSHDFHASVISRIQQLEVKLSQIQKENVNKHTLAREAVESLISGLHDKINQGVENGDIRQYLDSKIEELVLNSRESTEADLALRSALENLENITKGLSSKSSDQSKTLASLQSAITAMEKSASKSAARSASELSDAVKNALESYLSPHSTFVRSLSDIFPTKDSLESRISSLVTPSEYINTDSGLALPDYALESSGASILPKLTSPTYCRPFTHHPNRCRQSGAPPRTALQPDTSPGRCWSMKGQQGTLGIRLSQPIRITGFSLEHVDARIVQSRNSAPRRILLVENERVIGVAEYDVNGPVLQTWQITDEALSVRDLVFRIESNWGNQEWTCVYRVRVHGEAMGVAEEKE